MTDLHANLQLIRSPRAIFGSLCDNEERRYTEQSDHSAANDDVHVYGIMMSFSETEMGPQQHQSAEEVS